MAPLEHWIAIFLFLLQVLFEYITFTATSQVSVAKSSRERKPFFLQPSVVIIVRPIHVRVHLC